MDSMQIEFDANGINNIVIPRLDTAASNLRSGKGHLQNDWLTYSANFSPFIVPQSFSLRSELVNFAPHIRAIELKIEVLTTWLEETVTAMRDLESDTIRQRFGIDEMFDFDISTFNPDILSENPQAFISEFMYQYNISHEQAMVLIGAIISQQGIISILSAEMTDDGIELSNGFTSILLPDTDTSTRAVRESYISDFMARGMSREQAAMNFYTSLGYTREQARMNYISEKVELLTWSDVEDIIPSDQNFTFTVIDVRTGIEFQLNVHAYGSGHVDVEPSSREDTYAILESRGGTWDTRRSTWAWDPRPVWVVLEDRVIAGAMNGMPHSSGSISDNGVNGHFCIHFHNTTARSRNYQNNLRNAVNEAWDISQQL